ncbi:MAG: PRTRC system ThiF family protein [Nitrospiraceae bacterium]
MLHHLNKALATRQPMKTLVVGAGGTGSQVITALAQMDHALKSLGRAGCDVTVVDDDIVSEANVGRQWFFKADIGQYKGEVLVNRVNMTLGTQWHASNCKITASSRINHDLVIGCVDTRKARFAIMRAMEEGGPSMAYWLDFGNRRSDGQVILGQVSKARRKTNPPDKLPHAGELFPEIINAKIVDPDEGPSCSLAEALSKQSLFINRTLVAHGMAMLWELLYAGEIGYHGVFVNLKSGRTSPLPVDPKTWERFGYGKVKARLRERALQAESA